jgi:hypothetical protein
MHPAIQGFARHQPVNVTIQAVRDLADGHGLTTTVVAAIAWSIGIFAAFAWIATRQFRHATT